MRFFIQCLTPSSHNPITIIIFCRFVGPGTDQINTHQAPLFVDRIPDVPSRDRQIRHYRDDSLRTVFP
ncbi:hypothetical protein BGY98DRAFT_991196 [Russula aff. rugulosa BPL654]|nr:hypothetical protein BGY98DRAFT_991196 [Russula aff. rugulosa BPL654]